MNTRVHSGGNQAGGNDANDKVGGGKGLLSNIRVLDLSRILSGPGPPNCWATWVPTSSRSSGPAAVTTCATRARA